MDFITTNADPVAYEIRMDYDNPLIMNTFFSIKAKKHKMMNVTTTSGPPFYWPPESTACAADQRRQRVQFALQPSWPPGQRRLRPEEPGGEFQAAQHGGGS